MDKESKVHRPEIDIVRGLLIICVVALHVGIPSLYWTNLLGSFHMAAFIFCSGFCFNSQNIYDGPQKYFKKKLKQLYIPYVVFNVCFILLNNLLVMCNIYTNNEAFILADIGIANFYGLTEKINLWDTVRRTAGCLLFGRFGEPQLGGATWFLRVLFTISIFFYIFQYVIYRFCKRNYTVISKWGQLGVAVLLLTIGWKGHILGWNNTYQLLTCCSIYFVYVAGWLLAQTNIIGNLTLFVSLITVAICYCTLNIISSEAAIGINANMYSSISHLVIASLAGVIGCFAIASQLCKASIIGNVISCIGRQSLYIMLFHFVSFKIVTLLQVVYYEYPPYYLAAFPVLHTDGPWRILYILIGCFAPIILIRVIKHIAINVSNAFCIFRLNVVSKREVKHEKNR